MNCFALPCIIISFSFRFFFFLLLMHTLEGSFIDRRRDIYICSRDYLKQHHRLIDSFLTFIHSFHTRRWCRYIELVVSR